MNILLKEFEELSLHELYNLLQLRSEVFVVEQACIYQDIDGKDTDALHVLGFEEGTLVAYTRIFPPGYIYDEAAIGRVIVRQAKRKGNLGHEILHRSVSIVEEKFKNQNIKLSAQQHLTQFYEAHGFRKSGEGYLEDGIPHIAMVKSCVLH